MLKYTAFNIYLLNRKTKQNKQQTPQPTEILNAIEAIATMWS